MFFFDEDACLWKQCTTDVDLKYFCTSKQGSDGNLNVVRKALASTFMQLVTSYTQFQKAIGRINNNVRMGWATSTAV